MGPWVVSKQLKVLRQSPSIDILVFLGPHRSQHGPTIARITIPATNAMMLLFSHCVLVIPRSALIDFDRGENEYQAEKEQPDRTV